jgi:hypothetical protein
VDLFGDVVGSVDELNDRGEILTVEPAARHCNGTMR